MTLDDVQLLRKCVRGRFLDGQDNAIVLALEGLAWLADEDSVVTREMLIAEAATYDR